MAHVTDTHSIERKIVITLTEDESEILFGILDRVPMLQDKDTKALAETLMHMLGVPAAPTTLS